MPDQLANTTAEFEWTNVSPIRTEGQDIIFSLPRMEPDRFYPFRFKGHNCAAVVHKDGSLEVFELK